MQYSQSLVDPTYSQGNQVSETMKRLAEMVLKNSNPDGTLKTRPGKQDK